MCKGSYLFLVLLFSFLNLVAFPFLSLFFLICFWWQARFIVVDLCQCCLLQNQLRHWDCLREDTLKKKINLLLFFFLFFFFFFLLFQFLIRQETIEETNRTAAVVWSIQQLLRKPIILFSIELLSSFLSFLEKDRFFWFFLPDSFGFSDFMLQSLTIFFKFLILISFLFSFF